MHLIHFSKIAVLQSLKTCEKQTGKLLYEDIETLNEFHQHDIEISFYDVISKQLFLECLSQLRQEAALGKWPLLHIECHGSDDQTGIILADDTFLGWEELKPYLTLINIETQCNLLIIIGSCYGGHLMSIIQIIDRAPCWGMIGPTDEVLPNELLINFNRFYEKFFSTLNGDNSLEALLAEPLKTGRYHFSIARNFFKIVYVNYLQQYCTDSAYAKRAKVQSRQIKKENLPTRDSNGAILLSSKGAIKRMIKQHEKHSFEKYFQKFFMIDLYPQNKERFSSSHINVEKVRKNSKISSHKKRSRIKRPMQKKTNS